MVFSVRSRKTYKSNDPFIVMDEEENDMKKYRSTPRHSMWLSTMQDRFRIAILTVLGFYLRTKSLGNQFIAEAELETTQQINWYMQGKFFIGKFPPLSTLVGSFVSRIAGYYGNEDLVYDGQQFKDFPVIALRRLSTMLGTALIPLCYMTLRNMGHSRSTATLAAALLVFENGIITQSRYIVPDVYALFFSAAATCSWSFMNKYIQESNQEHSTESRIWNVITGLCIGCSISSKWSGSLTLPVIWSSVIYEIITKLSERKNSVMKTLKRLMIYAFTVGFLPLFVYYTIFQFHMGLVPSSGDHDLLLSPEFKYALEGNNFEPTQPKIAYGSSVVIKHRNTGGGYLHTHKVHYSTGSKQQQVSTYPYVDVNNLWTIHPSNKLYNASQPLKYVKNHDRIRLEHFASSRKLHSHDHRSAVSTRKEYLEVSAYGDKFIVDNNDVWILNILTDDGQILQDKSVIFQPLVHNFRLIHSRGCALVSIEAYLPENKQQEVACMNSAAKHVYSWTVETAMHQKEMDEPLLTIKTLSKFEQLKETHWLMYNYPNKMFNRIRDNGAKFVREGSPLAWFVGRHGMKLWSKLSGHSSYVVLNPMLQRFTLASLVSVLGFLSIRALYEKRQVPLPAVFTMPKTLLASETYIRSIIFFYSSTVIHTILLGALPSYTTSLSDILPCFYYGAGLIAVLFELSTLRLNAIPRHILFYTIVGLSAISFFKLSHFAYSNDGWTRSECESTKLGSIDCIEFPPSEHLQDAMPGSVSVKLPGKTENIRYNYGEEIETDEKIASLKEMEYLKAREEMTHRYHRAIPTPTLTPEEAVKWGDGVYEGAKQREEKHKAEAKKKVEEELVKKRALEEEERKKKEEKEAANAEKEQLAELKKDEVQKTMKNVQKKKKKQAMPDTQEVEEE